MVLGAIAEGGLRDKALAGITHQRFSDQGVL